MRMEEMKGRQELEGKAAIEGAGDPLLPLAVSTSQPWPWGLVSKSARFCTVEEAVT